MNNATGQRGLVAQYDVVCFDEVSGVSFDQKDGVNIMKGYMESGEFSRGRESIRADGSIVLVGNFDVDVAHQQRIGHLLSPCRRRCATTPRSWTASTLTCPVGMSQLNPTYFTHHFGLVSDFLSECWSRLRDQSRLASIQGRVNYSDALSGRDLSAVNKTVDGLLKLLYPMLRPPSATRTSNGPFCIALECRRRVKEQQRRIGAAEFRNTQFGYRLGEGVEQFVSTPELASPDSIGLDPLPPDKCGRFPRATATSAQGFTGSRRRTRPAQAHVVCSTKPRPRLSASFRVAEQNLIAQARQLVGDRDPREHNLTAQIRALDAAKTGAGLRLLILLALTSAMLQRSVRGGLIAVGNLSLGGGVETVHNAAQLPSTRWRRGHSPLAPGVCPPPTPRRQ